MSVLFDNIILVFEATDSRAPAAVFGPTSALMYSRPDPISQFDASLLSSAQGARLIMTDFIHDQMWPVWLS